MFSLILAAAALGTAAVVGLVVGTKKRPLLGVLAAAGVLLTVFACYGVLLALTLPM